MRFSTLCFLLALSWAAGSACTPPPADQAGTAPSAWNLEKKRALAARLRADGLDANAAAVYEDILRDEAGLSPAVVAGLSVNIAEILHAQGRYEDALTSLYRARLFPLEGERKRRVEALSIECLERLGRGAAADRLLDRATALDANADKESQGVVLAEIGNETITRAEFETLLASTELAGNPELRDDPDKLREVLENFVAQRVLVRKARKLGYDADPKVELAVDLATQQVLVRKLMAEELKDELSLTPEDLKLFFEARRDIFRTPGRMEIDHILVDDEEAEVRLRAELDAGGDFAALAERFSRHRPTSMKGGRVEEALIEGRPHPVFARPEKVFVTVGDTKAGAIAAQAHRSAQGLHVLRIRSREEGTPLAFEEVREDVARLARAERQQAAAGRLMREALESADVRIHGDRLK